MPQNEVIEDLGLDQYKYHFITEDELLPLEYAVELNRLIELEMEGSVG